MKTMIRSHSLIAIIACTLIAAIPATDWVFADEKDRGEYAEDHDEAFRARQDGSVLSLARVIAIVSPKIDGEIIEAEFEYEDGIPVYEFKYVTSQGQVRELYADARNGKIVEDKPD